MNKATYRKETEETRDQWSLLHNIAFGMCLDYLDPEDNMTEAEILSHPFYTTTMQTLVALFAELKND